MHFYALNKRVTKYHLLVDIPPNLRDASAKMDEGVIPDAKDQYLPFMGVVTSNIDPSLAPKGCQTFCVISGGASNLDPSKVDWEKWMVQVRKRVEIMLPNIKQHTLFVKEMTPVDIQRYGDGIMGDAVGASQSIDQVGDHRPSIFSPIKNLFHVGADMGKGNVATELASESAIRLEPYLRTAKS